MKLTEYKGICDRSEPPRMYAAYRKPKVEAFLGTLLRNHYAMAISCAIGCSVEYGKLKFNEDRHSTEFYGKTMNLYTCATNEQGESYVLSVDTVTITQQLPVYTVIDVTLHLKEYKDHAKVSNNDKIAGLRLIQSTLANSNTIDDLTTSLSGTKLFIRALVDVSKITSMPCIGLRLTPELMAELEKFRGGSL